MKPDSRLLNITVAAIALLPISLFAQYAYACIQFPYSIDYAEGILLEQARLIFTARAYGSIETWPAIVFHYTPFFHAATNLISGVTGLDLLATGRALSAGFTILLCVLVGRLAIMGDRGISLPADSLSAGLLAACSAISIPALFNWSPQMHTDLAALGLSVLGFYLAMAALERPRLAVLAGIVFVLAVYTKQTSIAAPAAGFLTLLFYRPRTALAGIATSVVLGAIALVVLALATQGRFLQHIFFYNMNRYSLEWLVRNSSALLLCAPIVVAGLLYVLPHAWRTAFLKSNGDGGLLSRLKSLDPILAGLSIYLLTSGLMILMCGKSGAGPHYTMEFAVVCAVMFGRCFLREITTARASKGLAVRVMVLVLVLAFAGQVAILVGFKKDANLLLSREYVAEHDALFNFIKATEKPVISDEMVMVVKSGKDIQWEPAIFAELASKGMWSEAPLIDRLNRKYFGAIVTAGDHGNFYFDARYTPTVYKAMAENYPVKRRYWIYTVHLPRPTAAGVPGQKP
jgi:hypothetical protein